MPEMQVKFLDVVEDEGKVVVSQRRAVATLELARGMIGQKSFM